MSADVIHWLKREIALHLLHARRLSLQGWPKEAMDHRRNALKALRILRCHAPGWSRIHEQAQARFQFNQVKGVE